MNKAIVTSLGAAVFASLFSLTAHAQETKGSAKAGEAKVWICVGCHAIGSLDLGAQFSGQIPYDTNRVLYGPFVNPMVGPMQLYVGMIPTHSEHVSEGRMCSPCHTLITQTTDLNGNATGNHFVEQATFHEWN
ncbi:MAG: hypothetical protein EBV00_02875 [Burkholderiaceae bacterium]|nr:hypothetical protein [Burkholderiaceae bacterium]